MFGYETKDLFFLPNDLMLFGTCHEEWDDRGRTDITVKACKCSHRQNQIHRQARLGAIQTQLILAPSISSWHALF